MRTTDERRGSPDRSRAGNYRSEGSPCCPAQRSRNPRRGYPDRANSGTARHVDRRRETRNRLREQHGYDFTRLVAPAGPTANRPVTPFTGDLRINETADAIDYYSNGAWFQTSTGGGASTWIDLTDTDPTTFAGSAGLPVVVNSGGTGLEFGSASPVPVADLDLGGFDLVNAGPNTPTRTEVTFTATGLYSYKHSKGARPMAQVVDSSGLEIDVCVRHADIDTIILSFDGTLTNALLLLQ